MAFFAGYLINGGVYAYYRGLMDFMKFGIFVTNRAVHIRQESTL